MIKRLGLALVLVGSLANADTKAEKTAKLSITVPDGWKLNVKDLGLTGESKDKDVAVLAWPVDAADADAAKKKLEGELYSAIASLKWDKPTTGKAHGMTATYLSGSGNGVGGDIAVKAEVIGPGAAKKWLLVALAVKVDKLDAHKAEIQTVLDSVQVAK